MHYETDLTLPDYIETPQPPLDRQDVNQDLGLSADLVDSGVVTAFFERRNENQFLNSPGVKASYMRPRCNEKTYSLMRAKVSQEDFDQRMKVKKSTKFLKPEETIPFKNMMKKIKNHQHACGGNPEKLTVTLNDILTPRERLAETLAPRVDHITGGDSSP